MRVAAACVVLLLLATVVAGFHLPDVDKLPAPGANDWFQVVAYRKGYESFHPTQCFSPTCDNAVIFNYEVCLSCGELAAADFVATGDEGDITFNIKNLLGSVISNEQDQCAYRHYVDQIKLIQDTQFDSRVYVNIIEGDSVADVVQSCTPSECPADPYTIINIVVPSICKDECHPECDSKHSVQPHSSEEDYEELISDPFRTTPFFQLAGTDFKINVTACEAFQPPNPPTLAWTRVPEYLTEDPKYPCPEGDRVRCLPVVKGVRYIGTGAQHDYHPNPEPETETFTWEFELHIAEGCIGRYDGEFQPSWSPMIPHTGNVAAVNFQFAAVESLDALSLLPGGHCSSGDCCDMVRYCVQDLMYNFDIKSTGADAGWRDYDILCPYPVCNYAYEFDPRMRLCTKKAPGQGGAHLMHVPYYNMRDCMADYSRSNQQWCSSPLAKAWRRCKARSGVA